MAPVGAVSRILEALSKEGISAEVLDEAVDDVDLHSAQAGIGKQRRPMWYLLAQIP